VNGGAGSYTFTATETLPPGLSSGGTLNGTSTTAGTFTVTIIADDGQSFDTQRYTLTVGASGGRLTSCVPTATPELGWDELLATGLLPLGAMLLYRRRRARRAAQ